MASGIHVSRRGLSFASLLLLCPVVSSCDQDTPSSQVGADASEGAVTPSLSTALAHANDGASTHEHVLRGGGFDPAIANKEGLIEMLRRSGKLRAGASLSEAYEAVDAYLRDRVSRVEGGGLPLGEEVRQLLQRQRKLQAERALRARQAAPKLLDAGPQTPPALERTAFDGTVLEPRLLALLVEFPDFPHNSIGPDETKMYYPDYSVDHYQQLLFSPDTYTGPNGEALRTARNWYWAQSGNSYDLDGAVAGWFGATQPAAYYGGNGTSGSDAQPRELVSEAVLAFAASTDLDLNQFDNNDPYDMDGDGDLAEPDGIIDHLLIFHSSVGEEAGGGSLGENAIWSHRWQLPGVLPLPGTSTGLPYWDGQLVALGYTIQPADAAIGVVVHEHGHDIGLPDEYDTQYTGTGEPVGLWSAMSSGSWAGSLPGSKPTSMSPYARESLQNQHGGNWLVGASIDALDLNRWGKYALLDEASSKGRNHDYVRVNLPPKSKRVVTPVAGSQAYHGGADNNLTHTMKHTLDLTGASVNARLEFQTWYDIETDWDYAYVQVDDGSGTGPVSIAGNITTEENPNATNLGHGITGASDWAPAVFDLSAYLGQQIEVSIMYQTDGAVINPGIYVDELQFVVDDAVVATDGAEGASIFALDGFYATDGMVFSDHYYLLELRSHSGVDAGLAERAVYGGQIISYNRGLVVWYVDDSFTDNWVGLHPGEGFLGVVDADQRPVAWQSVETDEITTYGNTQLQIRDAAFSRRRSPGLSLELDNVEDPAASTYLEDRFNFGQAAFRDGRSYWNETVPDAGRKLAPYGLSFEVVYESRDGGVALIRLSRR